MAVTPRQQGGGEPRSRIKSQERVGKDGYFLEFQRIGKTVKVSAIDPRTGTEVSTLGPASAGEAELGRAAVRKLEYVLAKKG